MKTTLPSIELKRILVPVDFSRASHEGLRYAAMVAEKFGAKLDLLYVVEPPSYPDWGYAHLVIRDAKLRKAAEERLPQFAEECGIHPRLLESADVSVGDADSEIVKAACARNTDLIIIASRGMTTLKHTLIGSTAERVVRHAACPVLAVRERVLRATVPTIQILQLKRILVPTDFSAASKKAFPYASALARQFDAALMLVLRCSWHFPGGIQSHRDGDRREAAHRPGQETTTKAPRQRSPGGSAGRDSGIERRSCTRDHQSGERT
jgi:nucleotide-binding universal stress UspA family protein